MSIYLSASSIKDFISCPQKVLYRRTKPFPEVKSRAMIVGEIAHKAIEVGWSNKKLAYKVIEDGIEREGLSSKDRVDLQFYVDIFHLNFRHLLSKEDLVEYNFKISLYDDVFIVGKIDRISNGNLFDWKTGAKIATRLEGDVQCIIYDFAYRKIFGKEPASICLGALAKGELIPYRRDEFYVKELFDRVIPRMIKTIKNETYERLGIFNHSCFNCSYKLGCLGRGSGEEEYVVDNLVVTE